MNFGKDFGHNFSIYFWDGFWTYFSGGGLGINFGNFLSMNFCKDFGHTFLDNF